MECPRCNSSRVERRPPSQISPYPGYECRKCGLLMRSRGTLPLYLIVLFVGCAFLIGFIVLVVSGEVGFVLPGGSVVIGTICAAYSIRQIVRPVPRPSREHDDEDDEDEPGWKHGARKR
jgi:hypothetical protein